MCSMVVWFRKLSYHLNKVFNSEVPSMFMEHVFFP